MVKDGEELPRAVTLLCGQHGIRHADVAEWRIGEDAVTVLTKRGQKYTAVLLRLSYPPQSPRGRGEDGQSDGGVREAPAKATVRSGRRKR